MLPSNKNIKEQRTARTARLKSKVQAINQHSEHFNQLYFQFPEPQKAINSFKYNTTAFKAPKDKIYTAETYDSRRNVIKEKIKFRIKQQLWNFLKKNNEKQEAIQPIQQNSQYFLHQQRNNSLSFGYIKGKSLKRFERDSQHAKKNWSVVSESCRNLDKERSKTQRENTSQQNKSVRRRKWSSVKMKEHDRAIVLKKQNLISKNCFSLQKFEVLQIEPWRSPDDSEHQLLE